LPPNQPALQARRETDQGEGSTKDPTEDVELGHGASESWERNCNEQSPDDRNRDTDPRRDESEDELQGIEQVIDGCVMAAARHGKMEHPGGVDDKEKAISRLH
jgi:hypothetical protein